MEWRSEALTAVLMNSQVLQDVTPYRLLTDDTSLTLQQNVTFQPKAAQFCWHEAVRGTNWGKNDRQVIAVAERSAAS
jgi:hypothetical protein